MTLDEVRVEIDAVDSQIKPLFLRRMECAGHVAAAKSKTGADVFAGERENQIIEKRTEDVDPLIRSEYTAFLKHLMSVSRRYQYGILTGMQEAVITAALEAAGLHTEMPHSQVEVGFQCQKADSNLNLFLDAARLNGISIDRMELEACDGKQQVRLTLDGSLQESNMRCLLCQMGKEAEGFKILTLR